MFKVKVTTKKEAIREEIIYQILDNLDISDITIDVVVGHHFGPWWYDLYFYIIRPLPLRIWPEFLDIDDRLRRYDQKKDYGLQLIFDHEDDMKLFLKKKPRHLKCLS